MPENNLVEGVDYYIDKNGLLVFTTKYLLDRGYCCGNGCRHCPYTGEQKNTGEKK
ncbi:MAG: DUF5522 domain-containing protein [Chitinophagales bacterium]